MGGLFIKWGTRQAAEPPSAAPAAPADAVATSVVFPKFLAGLSQRPTPLLLDLGSVVGANVSFLGDRLACRLLIGDVYRDIESGRTPLAEILVPRLASTIPAPLDGILCWDVFDYLDRATAQAVATLLTGRLAPGGLIHGFFGTIPGELTTHTRYALQSATSFMCRPEPIRAMKRTVLTTRDLSVMFSGLTVVDSVLLKSQRRETLLRKG